ncbi:SufB/SufD family protein [Methylacidiphilum caldifontis]|uniref:Cysteine desulfurase n=1 Tax=Methylacidiphilum caldifontis TaxID=2795386 RepID=A0A4Y8PG11_9BACT|nr:SufD family Fe-S cluster assembly protein [Methylacidiphilum caldifontis]QSR88028.1 SufD family Fe-S cluster assembly protein [Methylacidiphilum caldifontis]TFE69565.1 cysteine desulfurase [Methylacidiphilum caldifontis]
MQLIQNNSVVPKDIERPYPNWFENRRKQSLLEFESLPFPQRKNEKWRFSSLEKIKWDGYSSKVQVSPFDIEKLSSFFPFENSFGAIVYGNNDLLFYTPIPEKLQKLGIIFSPLNEALALYPNLLREHLFKETLCMGSEKFEALHRSKTESGAVLYVPKNIEIQEFLELGFWITEPFAAIYPHILIVLEEGSKAKIQLNFRSLNPRGGLSCSAIESYLGRSSFLELVCVQQWADEVNSFMFSSSTVGQDAQCTSLYVNVGGSYNRFEGKTHLSGAGASAEILSATIAKNSQEFDQRTLQIHSAPYTTSDLLFKNVLFDSAKTIFSGMIDVSAEAQKTDAYQSNRNLILGENAEADSLPGLEIMADDVRCTHGATTGGIAKEELFYSQQRGIPKAVFEKLYSIGFLSECIQRIKNPQVVDRLLDFLDTSLQI